MKSLLTLLLLASAAQVAAACGEYRGGYQTTVAASADRTWELCLQTLERDFAPVSFERPKGKDFKIEGPFYSIEGSSVSDPHLATADHWAIVYRPWPDGSNPPGDRVAVSVTAQADQTKLWVTSNNPRNAAAVIDAILGTLEENGVEETA